MTNEIFDKTKNNNAIFNKSKPYKWVTVKGKKIRVEIVAIIPEGYSYVMDYMDYALFVQKTMFADDDKYLLILKKTVRNNTNNIQNI